jgi:hypothetical protein
LANPTTRIFAELLIDCVESPTTRAVVVGMLRDAPNSRSHPPKEHSPARRSVLSVRVDVSARGPTPRESGSLEVPTTGGAAQDGLYAEDQDPATCLSRFPEIEEADMAWPKTVRMNLLVVLLIGVALTALVQIWIALSGGVVWVLLALSAVVALTLIAAGWYRRAETRRDLSTSDSPSFGDVLARRYASEAPKL